MIRRSSQNSRPRKVRGFSLLELVIVVAMAVPGVRRSLQYYSLRSAVTSVTGAVQSARYNAIFHGCKYQLVFSAASKSYTVASQVPAAGANTCLAAFGAASTAIPLMGNGAALTADTTMQFFPDGTIVTVPASNPMQISVSYTSSGLVPEVITVSKYGKINVAP